MSPARAGDDWAARKRGAGCALCDPERAGAGRMRVAALRTSTLYLERDQTYPGYCVLVFDRRHAAGLEALSEAERSDFLADLARAALAVADCFAPDHMNYAMLGNMVPHLHAHLIPRYRDDPRWGRPIWGDAPPPPAVATSDAELAGRVEGLRRALEKT
jgi:diadenosine tetraphosphate (Ap4A) HIT family hydrolase